MLFCLSVPSVGSRRTPILALLLLLYSTPPAFAQENRWGFGHDVGVWTGTTNDAVFALGLHLDYYVDHNFSFGGMALFTPVGDLTQIGIAGVAKYHLRFVNGVNIVPFAGLGLVHADLNHGGPKPVDRNDTSHLIPLGLSLEYRMGPTVALSSTLMGICTTSRFLRPFSMTVRVWPYCSVFGGGPDAGPQAP